MKCLLVDTDSHNGFPNLALMKISAWLKETDNNVDLIRGIPEAAPLVHYDQVYISCIFFQNKEAVLDYAAQFPRDTKVEVGGSGIDLRATLPDAVEHIMPDYDIYGIDYSLGFTSRGCIRSCDFCIVPKKEGMIYDNAPIDEFLDPRHTKLILLDNNFQASPRFRENLHEIIMLGLKVNFNQGLDARLMNDEFAALLSETRYYSQSFKTRGFHMALDDPRTTKSFLRACDILEGYGIPMRHIMIYILVGFNTTFEQDMQRIRTVIDRGCVPYVMRYNMVRSPELNRLARWVNRKYYQFVKWQDFRQST